MKNEKKSKTEKPRVSIIVPVYNSEKYLRGCVGSILAQTYRNLEVILVDDGSTDSSPSICDQYSSEDERVRVIHQDNQGLSGARNTGIDISSSDYIMFVDSDDEILPTMVDELWYVMDAENADIAQCGFHEIRNNHEPVIDDADKQFEPSKIGEYKVFEKHGLMWEILYLPTIVQWNKLYKKKIFDDLRFPVGKYHEDEFVIHRELYAASKKVDIDRQLYLYFRRDESITMNPNMQKLLHVCEALYGRLVFLNENGFDVLAVRTYADLGYYISNARFARKLFDDSDANYGRILEIKRKSEVYFGYIQSGVPFKRKVRNRLMMVKYWLWLRKLMIKSMLRKRKNNEQKVS